MKETNAKGEMNGLKCLYTTQRINSSNMRQYRLHEMRLYKDFIETISDFGKIPEVSLKEVEKLAEQK